MRLRRRFLIAHSHCADTVFAVSRPETMVETITAAQPGSALLSFRTHFVGNGFIRSVVMVLPVVPGRADAITVSASALMRN